MSICHIASCGLFTNKPTTTESRPFTHHNNDVSSSPPTSDAFSKLHDFNRAHNLAERRQVLNMHRTNMMKQARRVRLALTMMLLASTALDNTEAFDLGSGLSVSPFGKARSNRRRHIAQRSSKLSMYHKLSSLDICFVHFPSPNIPSNRPSILAITLLQSSGRGGVFQRRSSPGT